jgi:hypothetical protein
MDTEAMAGQFARGTGAGEAGRAMQAGQEPLAAPVLRLGTRRLDDERYEGVLRRGTKIVAACGHRHHNRSESTRTNGTSAWHCARSLAMAARHPGYAAEAATRIRNGLSDYIRAYATSGSDAGRLRAAAAAQADAFLAGLPAVAEVIGNEPVYGYSGRVEIAPLPPQGVTCAGCSAPIEPRRYTPQRGWADWWTIRPAGNPWAKTDNRCPAPGAYDHQPATQENRP